MSEEWNTITYKKPKSENSKPDPDAEQFSYQSENDTVVFHKNKPITTTVLNTSQPNTAKPGSNSAFHKIDQSTTGGTIKKVSLSTAQLLNKALVAKKWKQKDLVAHIGGRAGVNLQDVQQIAQGKAIANDAKLSAIEKGLNIHLRGKLAGQQIAKPKTKK